MAVRDGHVRDPSVNGPSWNLEVQLYWIYVVLLALVFVAWAARWLVERRRGLINIAYPGGRVVRVPVGYAVLDASRHASIPHAAICGGRGRCTTCRIRVLRGVDTLPPPSASEQALLDDCTLVRVYVWHVNYVPAVIPRCFRCCRQTSARASTST